MSKHGMLWLDFPSIIMFQHKLIEWQWFNSNAMLFIAIPIGLSNQIDDAQSVYRYDASQLYCWKMWTYALQLTLHWSNFDFE